MLDQNNEYLRETSNAMYELDRDRLIRQQCQAREDFLYWERIKENRTKNLLAEIEAQKAELKSQKAELKSQKAELKSQKAELKSQKAELAAKDARIAELLARLDEADK